MELWSLRAGVGEPRRDPRGTLVAPAVRFHPGSSTCCPTRLRAGRRQVSVAGMVLPPPPWRGQSKLQRGLSAATGNRHGGQEAKLKASSAFVGSSTTSEGVSS